MRQTLQLTLVFPVFGASGFYAFPPSTGTSFLMATLVFNSFWITLYWRKIWRQWAFSRQVKI